MGLPQRIAELERELAEAQSDIELRMARLRALAHELKELKGLAQLRGPIKDAALTDAILQLLRNSAVLSPTQIQTQLAAAGRDVPLNKVTATLTYLVKQQRVSRTGRGEYMAT
jgi:hypothetical protein